MKLILGIDTETTGVTALDKVCQVAAILVNPVTLETVDQFCTLVDPQMPVNPAAQAVHGISSESLVGQPLMEDVWQTSPLAKWIAEADVLFGHNVQFDVRMLGDDAFKHLTVLDTLRLARACWPQWGSHKLQNCVNQLSLPERAAHDALGDIESSADILRYLNLNHGHQMPDLLKLGARPKGDLRSHILNRLTA